METEKQHNLKTRLEVWDEYLATTIHDTKQPLVVFMIDMAYALIFSGERYHPMVDPNNQGELESYIISRGYDKVILKRVEQ